MRLLLLRHAPAEDRASFAETGRTDAERPLTEEGRRRMRKVAEALAGQVPEVRLIATSRHLRARESAEILARALPERPVLSEQAEFEPDGTSAAMLKFVQSQKSLPFLACVGHEPNLSRFASLLLSGRDRSFLELRKGGACLLEFSGRVAPGAATLLWHLTASQARALR